MTVDQKRHIGVIGVALFAFFVLLLVDLVIAISFSATTAPLAKSCLFIEAAVKVWMCVGLIHEGRLTMEGSRDQR